MALYHTYRPQTFGTVIGQEPIVQTLTQQIKTGRMGHAYLFCGSRGVGKTTLARIMAKAANCKSRIAGAAEPCDLCPSCHDIGAGKAMDVIEMDAASHTGVDDIRETILERAQFQPAASRYKIFIIDEVHMLSTAAFNALLKTIEEPPPHLVFILATTELHKVPETVVSRCQKFVFQKIPAAELSNHVRAVAGREGVQIADAVLEQIVRKSDGCARDAVSLLDQLLSMGETVISAETASLFLPTTPADDLVRIVRALLSKDAPGALASLRELADRGAHLAQCATDIVDRLRSALLLQSGVPADRLDAGYSPEAIENLRRESAGLSPRDLVTLIDILLRRRQEIKSSPLPILPLELGVIEWCAPAVLPRAATEAVIQAENHIPAHLPQGNSEKGAGQNIDAVKTVWPQFLQQTETEAPSLMSILKTAKVVGLEGTTIVAVVPYSFHRDKLMEKTCVKKLENRISAIIRSPLRFDIRVAESLPRAPDTELAEVAALLGGEVVSV